jgi:hypothetical protein
MSFDAFLSCYESGDHGYFPIEVIELAFGDAVTCKEEESKRDGRSFFWRLEYPVEQAPNQPKTFVFNGREYPYVVQDGAELYFGEKGGEGLTSGFMIAGPAGNLRFYESILAILRVTNTALYCAGACPPMVGKEDSINHLPSEMIETLGEAVIIRHPKEIIDRFSVA